MSRLAAIALSCLIALTTSGAAQQSVPGSRSAFDFGFVAIDGTPMPLADFRGKVMLVVNTASFCGYTHQYQGLQALHERYSSRGLVVIGVPANDFGSQEPKSNGEIAEFCQGAFNVTFPLAEKQVVKGTTAHAFYLWARQTAGDANVPRWNFHKYLVDRSGKLIGAYPSPVEPLSPRLIEAIETALGKPS